MEGKENLTRLTALVVTILLLATTLGPGYGGATGAAARPVPGVSYSSRGLFFFNTSDPRASDATGVQAEVTSFAMPAYSGAGPASFQLVVGVSDGATLVVAGLEANTSLTGNTVDAFAAVLNKSTLAVNNLVLGSAPPIGSLVSLEVSLDSAHAWVASVNGTPLLNWSTTGSPLPSPSDLYLATLLSWNSTRWVPAQVYLPRMVEVDNASNGWIVPKDECVTWGASTTNVSDLLPPWSFTTALSSPQYVPDEVLMSTSTPGTINGSSTNELWTSVPTLVAQLSGEPTISSVVEGQSFGIDWHVQGPATPLAGVRVAYWNSFGGPYANSTTDAKGWANVTLVAPNVSNPRDLFLNGTVLNGTYLGAGSAVILVTSVVKLSVVLTEHPATSGGVSQAELVVQVTNAGLPQGGVLLYPAANLGGGSFVPVAPWSTNAAGWAYGNYTPQDVAANITVWVNASYAGASASSQIQLVVNGGHTAPAPSSSGTPLWEYGALGAVTALGIALTILVLSRARRRATAEEESGEDPPPEKPG